MELSDIAQSRKTSGTGDQQESTDLTIETVLLHYGAKKVPQGYGWKKMRCPFKQYHTDSRASAGVNHGLNAYKCQACPMSGDPIAIIRKAENLKTRREAVERARAIFGQSIMDVSPSTTRKPKRRPRGNKRWQDILD